MTDFNDHHDQRSKWREELKNKIHDRRSHMMGGMYKGRIWTGVFILIIGVVALLKASNTIPPEWTRIYTWTVFLIGLGLFTGLRHGFRGIAWLILLIVGGFFLADKIDPTLLPRNYTGPIILIIVGVIFILRPRRRWHWDPMEKKNSPVTPADSLADSATSYSKEDYVNATSIFGGTKKNILTKNFRGGDIVNIFGGTELNLSQADINEEAIIELTTIFGGLKLIIPSNWTVKSEAAVVFGGIEDKRAMPSLNEPTNKILVLKGTV